MMKNYLVITLLVLLNIGNAQTYNIDKYTTLESKGEIPTAFLTSASESFKKDKNSNENKKLNKDFFLGTRFFMRDLLSGGTVLFNDEVTLYVQKVAKNVLKSEKGLFDKLHYYVLKNNVPNAFCTDQGYVFITTGLLARLETEAQLAFILAHETAHYLKHHVQDGYIRFNKVKDGKGAYKKLTYIQKIEELSKYSKSDELSADNEGVGLFLETEYDANDIFDAFDILLYSHLPYANVKFDKSFLETDIMQIPADLFLTIADSIQVVDDMDDSKKTHPNIKTRKQKVLDYIEGREIIDGKKYLSKENNGSKHFIISETTFLHIRDLCRFESINIDLRNKEYANAIYSAFLLKNDYPSNEFLEFSLLKSFYGIAKHKKFGKVEQVSESKEKIQGERHPLDFFIESISQAQAEVMACRYAYDLKIKYPHNSVIDVYYTDIKTDLALLNEQNFNYKLLRDKAKTLKDPLIHKELLLKDSVITIDTNIIEKTNQTKSKLTDATKEVDTTQSGINELTETSDSVSYFQNNDFHHYALYDLVKNEKLIDELIKIELNARDELEQKKSLALDFNTYRENYNTEKIHIEKAIVFEPFVINTKLKGTKKFQKSEKKSYEYSEIYTENFSNLNIETDLLDSKQLDTNDVSTYNEIGLINEWLGEIANNEGVEMIFPSYDRMVLLTEKYGTSNIILTGVHLYSKEIEHIYARLFFSLFVLPAPFIIADTFRDLNNIASTAIVLNILTNEVVYKENVTLSLKGNKRNMRYIIFNTMANINYQIK